MLLKLFHEREGILPNSFYEAVLSSNQNQIRTYHKKRIIGLEV
jgi:hypothetical protein